MIFYYYYLKKNKYIVIFFVLKSEQQDAFKNGKIERVKVDIRSFLITASSDSLTLVIYNLHYKLMILQRKHNQLKAT